MTEADWLRVTPWFRDPLDQLPDGLQRLSAIATRPLSNLLIDH